MQDILIDTNGILKLPAILKIGQPIVLKELMNEISPVVRVIFGCRVICGFCLRLFLDFSVYFFFIYIFERSL